MKAGSWLRALARPHDPAEDALWPRALAGGRAAATALTLAVFVASLTIHDLRLFRFSAAFVGGGLAIAVYAATPTLFASRLVSRAMADAPRSPGTWLESAVLRRRAALVASIMLLVVWLIFFSSGRTPRW